MRHAHALAALTALCLALLPGCDDDGGSGSGSGDAGPGPSGEPFALRFYDEDGPVTVEDGRVPWVWGFQGGTMIRPLIVLPDSAPFSPGDDARVKVTHRADPAAPEAFRVDPLFESFDAYLVVDRAGGDLVIGPLDDQLSGGELDGVRLVLRVEVEGMPGAVERTLELYGPEPPDDPCLTFAPSLGTGGCNYAELPGSIRLTASPAADDTCISELSGTFEVAGGEAADACLDRYGWAVEELPVPATVMTRVRARCLVEEGYIVDDTIDGTLSFQVEGACSPGPDVFLGSHIYEACRCD